jgi:ArsR family transcriptional regulator
LAATKHRSRARLHRPPNDALFNLLVKWCDVADNVFAALASTARRKILAYLSATDMTAGEIADRFAMSKPAISKHLQILEGAGLVKSEKIGQFVHYSIVRENISNTLNTFVQEVCPVSRPLKRESARIKERRKS